MSLGYSCPPKHTPTRRNALTHTPQLPGHALEPPSFTPKALCLWHSRAYRGTSQSPSPWSHAPRTLPLAQVSAVCPSSDFLAPEESKSDPLWGAAAHAPSWRGHGSWTPRHGASCCILPPCLLVPRIWPLTSSLLLDSPGQLLTCSTPAVSRAACPWPPGGVPESQAGLAAEQPCLTGLCLLRGAPQLVLRRGWGGGWPGVLLGLLTTCLLSQQGPAAASVPCSAGRGLRQHCSGLRVHPQAVGSSLI